MTLLPIVVRELRVVARGSNFYLRRFSTALASLAFWGYLMLMNGLLGGRMGGGGAVFSSLTYLALIYCIVLARNTADCVSEEKREGTLGLLFLTDLKGYDIALGKLCSNSVRTLYGLLAGVPVVCCALVMGGVTGAEIWLTLLALLNIFFFSHTAGLLISTVSRDSRRANAGTGFLLGAFFIGIPVSEWLLRVSPFYSQFIRVAEFVQPFNPYYAFSEAAAVGTSHSHYWSSLIEVNLISWLFLALASFFLPRSWQDKPAKRRTRWSDLTHRWYFGSPEFRERLRLRLIGLNPFLWLVSRNQLGQIMVWAVLGLFGCVWFLIWTWAEFALDDAIGYFITIAVMNHSVLKFWMASEASAHLSEQRRSGALEYLLACTPLSVAEIISGQWLALRRRFLGPSIAVLVADVIFIAASFNRNAALDSEARTYFICCMLAGMVMFGADALAIGRLAMWRAMIEKKPRTAAGSTAFRILVLPWIVFGVFAPFGIYRSPWAAIIWWFLIGIGLDIGFGSFAEMNLTTRFREQAALRPEETLGLLGRLGRALGKMTR